MDIFSAQNLNDAMPQWGTEVSSSVAGFTSMPPSASPHAGRASEQPLAQSVAQPSPKPTQMNPLELLPKGHIQRIVAELRAEQDPEGHKKFSDGVIDVLQKVCRANTNAPYSYASR